MASSAPLLSTRALLSLLSLLLLTTAASAADPPFTNNTAVTWTPSPGGSSQTACAPPSFARADDLAPADWRQCAALASDWVSDHGAFAVRSNASFVPVLVDGDGTCTLAVRAADAQADDPPTYALGDGDVAKILDGALNDYSDGTELAVRGEVSCDVQGGGDRAALQWQILDSSA